MRSPSIGFIGGGNMARSLIGGLLARQHAREAIAVAEPLAAARESLARDFGIATTGDNAELAARCELLVLAVKPQVMKDVCTGLADAARQQRPVILSIAAGVRIAQLQQWLGADLAVVRAMPNTPALYGAGVSGVIASPQAGDAQRELAADVLRAAGRTVWIEREELMDAVTAVSGSGPAYFFLLIEALEAAGVAQGLPAETARELAVQTCRGAAWMASEGSEAPATLRERVTSPGGTTAAALAAFESGGFRALVQRAVQAATLRGREMAAQLGD